MTNACEVTMPLQLTALRNNLATWSVPLWAVPAVVHQMDESLPTGEFDPHLMGQYLQTTYFDTADFALRKARVPKQQYLTLRLRAYSPSAGAGGKYPSPTYALSAKTESEKYRAPVNQATAAQLLASPSVDLVGQLLTPDVVARLLQLLDGEPLAPVVTVCAQRYAVEDEVDRLTLDVDVHTDAGKHLPFGVLEYKSTAADGVPPGKLPTPGLRPIKLSKFLWATER
jgi:hypothetical protein